MKLIMNTRRMITASPERGGGCAEGADGGIPLVTMTDTEQQKKKCTEKNLKVGLNTPILS